ncbi:PDZ domain-containing protein [Echinicola sp. CAU 1574]|uniref:PDZ domain-containing protein n=1 Tax=Echinicola arenosa TaxID=2774144 RepID=A0ABR9AM84_9BACT|nr:S41 family peptidase [Echinicola arenosa]MBD8489901.1 PDZ domain-containing protein [Echinicola arenosa]
MKNRNKIIALLLVIVVGGGVLFSFKGKNDKLFLIAKNLDIFASLIRELDTYYVDEIDPDELVTVGINAMLQELDPYTNYIPEEESDDFRTMTTGEYGGIGALIGNRIGKNMVLMPYKGFPAQSAGLRIGDELLWVDSVDVVDLATSEISKKLKGPANTPVEVIVKRDQDTLTFELTRKKIVITNVPYYGMVNDRVGYIKLTDFTTNAGDDVRKALVELKELGAEKLILDLRDNPGGILKEAVDIVNLFIPKGKEVVSTIGKLDNVNAVYKTNRSPVDKDIPLAVLVNERSASASEIVAGALQDYDRAVLIGRNTFGKGLVQSTIPLSYNSQVKVTTAKYYIPSGRCIQEIDYSKKDEDGNATTVADSLRREFKTKNGRTVWDGAGIRPDEKVESKTYAPITYSLVARSLVFEFVNDYFYKHDSIPSPRDFVVTDELYDEFTAWLAGREYDYITRVEKTIEDLEAYAKEEKYFEDIQSEIDSLKKSVSHNKEQDLVTFRNEIKEAIKDEVVSRYYYEGGVIEASLDSDDEIAKAVSILSDPSLYDSILQPKLAKK